MNRAEPRPVPRVSTKTTPRFPTPAPKRISATPAASASLTIETGRPRARPNSMPAGKSTQAGSMLAAERVTPSTTTDGMPIPIGAAAASSLSGSPLTIRRTRRTVASTTASGRDGFGVAIRCRSPTS